MHRSPAPTSLAKAASRASKKGFDRPLERYQTTSPEAGSTMAVTYSHS
jgi:hypothetical protein